MASKTISVPPHLRLELRPYEFRCSSPDLFFVEGSVFSSNVFALAFRAASEGMASSSVPSHAPRHEICGPVSGDPPISSSPRQTKSVPASRARRVWTCARVLRPCEAS